MPGGVRRLFAAVPALAALVVMAGCALGPGPVVTVLPTDGAAVPSSTPAPVPSNSVVPVSPTPVETEAPDADGVVDCSGAPVVLDAGSRSLTLSGDCAEVRVNGSALQVDAAAADIAVLIVSGERIVVSAGTVGQLSSRGNDNVVTAASVSMFDVEGDRNSLTATGAVEGVSFRGNDNAVRGASVGQVSDTGDRNTVG